MHKVNLNVAHWGWKEIAISVYMYITFREIKGKYINKLKVFLRDNYGINNIYLLNSARAGIYHSLLAMKKIKNNKSEVILPKYICPSVTEVIERAGLKPVRAEIKDDLTVKPESIESLISDKTLAVLMPHMYGKIADIEKISALSKSKGVFLIDDAAQLADEFYDNKLIGTFGDVGVISFSQSKTVVTGVRASGGVLICTNNDINELFKTTYENIPDSKSRKSPFMHFVMTCLFNKYLGKVDYYLTRLKVKFGLPRKDYYKSITKISNVDSRIALSQFDKISTIKERNKRVLKKYQEKLSKLDSIHITKINGHIPFLTRLIIRTHKITPEELSKFLNENGIETRKAYMNGSLSFNGEPDSGLLELPLIGLNEVDIDYVVSVLQQAEGTFLKDKPWQIIQPS